MKKIGLLSDTHSFLNENIFEYFKDVDEIWHAGDIGSVAVADALENFKPLKAVFGNIDGRELRQRFPEDLRWTTEGVEVLMTHIGGYPRKYQKRARAWFLNGERPQIFICGHSHILKIMPDPDFGFLHLNPGAAGKEGFHKVCTLLRFSIDNQKIGNMEIIEFKK
jgi:hypothetical protein